MLVSSVVVETTLSKTNTKTETWSSETKTHHWSKTKTKTFVRENRPMFNFIIRPKKIESDILGLCNNNNNNNNKLH